jgi:3-phosphoshikimate 1-carboxyvinyltransferase
MVTSFTVTPSSPLEGTITVAGDKSISHRAIIFGALAAGETTVSHLLEGEDVLCTIDILRSLGVTIEKKGKIWTIQGVAGVFTPPTKTLYCGNSGTTLRLMTGLLSGLPFESSLTGDASLNSRPMGRVMKPLAEMGAEIREVKEGEKRRIIISGKKLKGGKFQLPVASAQLKSALLLAGLSSGAPVTVVEPLKSRDHTERMLKAMGANIEVKGLMVTLKPEGKLKGLSIDVPGDISSAAFFLVAALINPNKKTKLTLKNIGINPTRTGILDILEKMGGKIEVTNNRIVCGEPVADLTVSPSSLKGVAIPPEIIPRLVDEIPILSVAAAFAEGKTVIRGAEELRIKETDRIKAIATELPKFGIPVKELPDGLEISGVKNPAGAKGISYGDHRMAMSLAVLGTVATGQTTVTDTACIATSFPDFQAVFKEIGGHLKTL